MESVKTEVLIENENLFRALICAPSAVVFVLFSINSVMSSGLIIFTVMFILMALYFTLSTLAYAAYYTNDLYEGSSERIINNSNLSRALNFTPLAILFAWLAVYSVDSSSHIFINVVFVLAALYFTLSTLAYAAYYTNDYHAENC